MAWKGIPLPVGVGRNRCYRWGRGAVVGMRLPPPSLMVEAVAELLRSGGGGAGARRHVRPGRSSPARIAWAELAGTVGAELTSVR